MVGALSGGNVPVKHTGEHGDKVTRKGVVATLVFADTLLVVSNTYSPPSYCTHMLHSSNFTTKKVSVNDTIKEETDVTKVANCTSDPDDTPIVLCYGHCLNNYHH